LARRLRHRPEALTFTLKKHAPGLVRAVLETGALSAFLHHGLILRGLPATCICARQQERRARCPGLAHLARRGRLEQVHIKDGAAHLVRTRLEVREQRSARTARWPTSCAAC
jgi:transposase